MRSTDRRQVEAIQLWANLRMVRWTRALVFSTVFLGVCTVIAAYIVRG
jgi:hypothetical protein